MRAWFAVLICLALPASAQAVSLQPVGSFTAPIAVASPPGDATRLFVVQRGGVVRLVRNGVTLATPFLTVPAGELTTDGERGLLSMTFAPDYASSGRLYTYSTDAGGDIRIDLWQRSANPDVALATRTLVLKIEHSSRSNHNGGDLHFGPEGLLYATTGDGGGANDPDNNGQTLIRTGTADQQSTALLGKLLRIAPGASGGYAVPPDNPFVGRLDARGEIFAYGLRNPFRFSIDRGTGNLLIGDVGQDDAEEVNFSATRGRGANFGWKCYEGTLPNDGTSPPCEPPGHVPPVFQYDRSGCQAITGGYVVRDAGLPGLVGRYVYADYCVGDIRSIVPSTGAGDTSTGIDVQDFSLVAFGEDACGRIYVVQSTGPVSRLIDGTASACASAPAALADTYDHAGSDTPLSVAAPGVLANDIGAVSAIRVGGPSNGTLTLNADGSFSYRPDEDFVGVDSFTYKARNGAVDSSVATVTITVAAGCDGQAATIVGTSAAQTLTGTAGADVIAGLGGNDVLQGRSGNDILCGGGGEDVLGGAGDNDVLRGGDADDRLDGSSGADELSGGGGSDVADYVARTVPLTVTIGDAAGDGAAGEGDDVQGDVERIRGGSANDVLTGDDDANVIYGREGNDRVTGNLGNDFLHGDAGNDTIDALDGPAPTDRLYCGAGVDATLADARDIRSTDCE